MYSVYPVWRKNIRASRNYYAETDNIPVAYPSEVHFHSWLEVECALC